MRYFIKENGIETDKKKKIAGYVEWNDKIDIPEWCPIIENGDK